MKRKVVLASLLFASQLACASDDIMAPISGFAREFILGTAITNATVTVLETGQKIVTDNHGNFGPFPYPVGKPITLTIEKWGYKTTQTGTIEVPPEGLNGPHNNITFQVASLPTYYLLNAIIGGKMDENKCHLVTTVLAYGKTMDDDPQGEVQAKVRITPAVDEIPFYFDVFKDGPLKGKTNPFTKGLTATSEDGGVGYYNLPPSDQPYSITAEKDGVTFTTAKFICRKDTLINISPPQGPMANSPSQEGNKHR